MSEFEKELGVSVEEAQTYSRTISYQDSRKMFKKKDKAKIINDSKLGEVSIYLIGSLPYALWKDNTERGVRHYY